jgi:hypothetical protein
MGTVNIEALDKIARFVKDAVPQPYEQDIITQLINSQEDYYRWSTSRNFLQVVAKV